MLTPEYYNYCTDDIVELYSRLDESIIRDITRRIIKTGKVTEGAKWQIAVEHSSGLLYDDIISMVAEYSDGSQAAVKAIFEDAGITSKNFDDEIYKMAGKNPIPLKSSPAMLQILTAGIIKTNGLIANLTKTTALTSQTAFINACALAEMQISSGAFDYNTAIRHAVDDAISQGTTVEYASGARRSLEAAIRTATMTGVSQTTGEISIANAIELGTYLMEITAHGGARPEHAKWQGKIVCIKGKKAGYLTLKEIGYGEVTGFKGANCKHDWFPFIEGISTRAYTRKRLKELENRTVTYDGKEIPQYEAEQMQRKMERDMRSTRCKAAGYDEAAKAAENNKLKEDFKTSFYDEAQKLKRQEKAYNNFCNQTGLPAQKDRLQTKPYNRSVSAKAVWGNRKAYEYDDLANELTSTRIKVDNKENVGTHIRSRALARNITVKDMRDALTSPLDVGKIRTDKSQQFVGERATVVINTETGKLVTTWPTSTNRAAKLKKRNDKQ